MKHLNFFKDKQNKQSYFCSIVDKHFNSENFAFYSERDRNNFLINYIHNYFTKYNDNSIENIFDVNKLISEFNDGDSRIYLNNGYVLQNVEIDPELKIRMDSQKYNL